MGRLTIQYTKIPETKRNSPLLIQRTKSSQPIKTPADRILFLQRTIGNQAVQQLIKSRTLQTKLKIGQPGDIYEQEADRVADAVMRMPEPQEASRGSPHIQRAYPMFEKDELRRQPIEEEEEELQRQPIEEEEEELQAKATSDHISEVNPGLESHIQSIKGGGQPLSENNRAYFEPRFGYDFNRVRVHTDTQAAESARGVNARAFTVGQDVVFGAGEYDLSAASGQQLMAHELTHVLQQGAFSKGAETTTPIMRVPEAGDSETLAERLNILGSNIPNPIVIRTPGAIAATVYFGQDNSLLDASNFAAVRELATQMRFMYQPTIVVEGHASTEGAEAYNLRLSELRRQMVIAILSAGSRDRLQVGGQAYGESMPALPETAQRGTELERQRSKNRRVEITIVTTPILSREEPQAPRHIDLRLPPVHPETPEERLTRILTTPSPELERRTFSITGAIEERFNDFMDNLLRGVGIDSDSIIGGLIKDGARALAERGARAVLDEALDSTSLSDEVREAIRNGIRGGMRQEFEF
jgi:outer membrane protein OmpA-like peptidoglycan-associated protein